MDEFTEKDRRAISRGLKYTEIVKTAQRWVMRDRTIRFSESRAELRRTTYCIVQIVTSCDKPDLIKYLTDIESTLNSVRDGEIDVGDSKIPDAVSFFEIARDIFRARAAYPMEIVRVSDDLFEG